MEAKSTRAYHAAHPSIPLFHLRLNIPLEARHTLQCGLGRDEGSQASSLSKNCRKVGGASGRCACSGVTRPSSIAIRTSDTVAPVKGWIPASISYATTETNQRSQLSAGLSLSAPPETYISMSRSACQAPSDCRKWFHPIAKGISLPQSPVSLLSRFRLTS